MARRFARSYVPVDPQPLPVDLGSNRPVYVADEGQGYPVILLHGLPGSHRDFRYLAPALRDVGARTISIDLPGFGKTPFTSFPALKSTNRSAIAVHVADALGISQFSILGHSFGGALAFHAAALFPERITSLGLVSSVGVSRHMGKRMFPSVLVRSLSIALATGLASQQLLDLGQNFYKKIGVGYAPTKRELEIVLEMTRLVDFSANRSAVRTVRCPTLLVSSKNDPIVDPASHARLVSAFDSKVPLRQIRFHRGGHALQKHSAYNIAQQHMWMVQRAAFRD